jgi:MarR family transcriptional regulator, organic hydroperoxide resistance regulator
MATAVATINTNGRTTKVWRLTQRKIAAPLLASLKAGGVAGRPRLPLTVSRPELLIDGSDQLYRQLVHGLLSLAALHEAIRDGIAAHLELGGVQHTILQSIRHLGTGQRVAVRDVADHLGLSGSFITMETARLQDMGLLEKRQSTTDRRKVSLVLTKKGVALFEKIAPLQQTIGDLQFGCLSARQFRELVPVVMRLVETSREALFLLHYVKHSDSSHRNLAANAAKMKKRVRRHSGKS